MSNNYEKLSPKNQCPLSKKSIGFKESKMKWKKEK